MRPFLAAAVLATLAAAPSRAARLPIRAYSSADGLPSDRISRIVRDSRGYLWILTREGLSRFDGTRFVNYDAGRGLPSADVRDLLEARDGTLWVGTLHGLAWLAAGRAGPLAAATLFSALAVGAGEANEVLSLLEDRQGRIWVGTSAGLAVLEQGARGPLAARPLSLEGVRGNGHPSIFAMVEDAEGCLWLATQAGLLHRCEGAPLEGLPVVSPPHDDRVFGVQVDAAGRIWAGHVDLGVFVLWPKPGPRALAEGTTLLAAAARLAPALGPDGRMRLPQRPGEVQRFSSAAGLAHDWARNGLSRTANGDIWAGTVAGLTRFGGERVQSYGPAQGLTAASVLPPTEDLAGNLWFGSGSAGVMRIARGGLTSYDEREGLGANVAISVFPGANGELYATARSSQKLWFSRHDGERFTPVPIGKFGWGWGQIGFQDHLGEWWLPSGEGVFRYRRTARLEELEKAAPFAHYGVAEGLAGRDVFRLYEDARGDVWIASYSPTGLSRWQRSTKALRRYGPADGLVASGIATAFGEDAAGGLWIGFEDGTVLRRRPGEERFVPFTGAPLAGAVEAIHLDRAGRLWIARDHDGVQRLDEPASAAPRASRLTMAQGLLSDDVTCVVEDAAGLLYLGTFAGVDRLDPATGVLRHYGVADGLANNLVRAAVRDRQGALWFATEGGVSRLFPEPEQKPALKPALITSLLVDGLPQPLSELGGTLVT